MNENMKLLVELQGMDLELVKLENSKSDFPAQKDELIKGIETANSDYASMKTNIEDLNKGIKKEEADVEMEKESLKKSKGKMDHITTNKEYDAVHAEIESLENNIKSKEDKIINMSEQVETLSKELEGMESKKTEVEEKNQPAIKTLDDDISQIDDKIAVVMGKRKQIEDKIPVKIKRNYNRILSGRKNKVVLGYIEQNERSCSFCHKSLSLQQVNEVRRGVDLILCESCGSILIWTEE